MKISYFFNFFQLSSNILNDNHTKREEEENMSTSSVNSSSGNILFLNRFKYYNDFIKNLLSLESESSKYEPLFACFCYNQWDAANEFIQCNSCVRYFHPECYIPKVPKGKHFQG